MVDVNESARPQTILVAEDDEILSRLIARFLESQSGVTTLLARDGAEALEILEQRRDDVDLLVTDIVMPSPGGFELAALAVERWPEIRVLYISGRYEDNVHVRWGLKQSGRFFLKKPFTQDAFVEMVTKALEHPPVRPTDGFAFLLGYPTVTARVIAQWALADGGTRDLRYELELPVRVHVADQVESTVGVTTNVSRGGIRIVTSGPLHALFVMGTDIKLRIELPGPGKRIRAVTAIGTVKRIERQSVTGGSTIGVAVQHYLPDVRR